MMNSPSPSQLTPAFTSNLYGQPSGLSSVALPQRGLSNTPFQRTVTPTSITPNFPISLQQTPPQQPPPQQASPNRSLFLGQRNILGSASSSVTNSAIPGFGQGQGLTIGFRRGDAFSSLLAGSDGGQPNLDLSEFPTLGNRSVPPNPLPTARNYVGMVSKPAQDPTPEFHIQQEDFPALPGAQNPPTTQSGESLRKTPTSMGSYDQALKESGKYMLSKPGSGQSKRGKVSNIPCGMVTDQFGMVGLLTFIRAAETDPNLVALASGIDLTTLGLNLNSPENLYSTFQSPWAESPCRPQDIDFHVPSEYLTNVFIREKLAPIKFNRYQEDLLFFLFYMNGGDVLQLAAAAELYQRDWRYHKEERVWITRAPGMEPVVKTNTYERGTYYYFDVQNWRKVAKEFHLEYDKLEERPHLPNFTPSLIQQQQSHGLVH
ncbi:hypothetical protein LSH36_146g01022 [Paralvinella palmiformis]|uniref:CCR4-NOT transcription complex subunit 2 n=1 Tax=Paralvinella palmiformis TaxID=53620 RepID=A0AAD9JUW9_9ANNE|nr:hypothetical protein LSH36_146g01022 [Paralvinella palmiformis]